MRVVMGCLLDCRSARYADRESRATPAGSVEGWVLPGEVSREREVYVPSQPYGFSTGTKMWLAMGITHSSPVVSAMGPLLKVKGVDYMSLTKAPSFHPS
jgi:hypothetical protein